MLRTAQRPATWTAALLMASLTAAPPALAVGLNDPPAPSGGEGGDGQSGSAGDPLRLTDEYLPLQTADVPGRPKPLLELGNDFMSTGELRDPITIPTGAVWSPSLLVWGDLRTGVSGIDRGSNSSGQWANRLDLFTEARMSPTERLVLGLRPLDKDGDFVGFDFDEGETTDGYNLDVQTLFFEGDFGEIFPKLDLTEKRALDFGFGIGRQPLSFQDGVMIADVIDAITVTRNSLRFWGASNIRATALLAWNDIERGNNIEDDNATVVGLLTATDIEDYYVELDLLATVSSADGSGAGGSGAGDGLYVGLGSTQRIGAMNSTFRVNVSQALDEGNAAVNDGALLTSVLSWVPHHTEDNFYFGSFVGIDNFTSAARSPVAGGPLANIGVLFAATGLGNVGAPISSAAGRVAGGALGYQQFFNHGRSQMIYEIAARVATSAGERDTAAIGGRYRRAIGQHTVLTVDGFGGIDEIDDGFVGGRLELLFKF